MSPARLALTNLAHDRPRTAVSAAGVAFAVLLLFMQLGFLGSVERTATLLYDRLAFDLLVASPEYQDLSRPSQLPREALARAAAADGVVAALPLTLAPASWREPASGRRWGLTIVAVEPSLIDRVFVGAVGRLFPTREEFSAMRSALARLDTVLLDRKSRPEFGRPEPGTVTELNGRRVELAGYFEVGTGFSYSGLLMASEETFARYTNRRPDRITFGLVRLAPGQDPEAARDRVQALVPDARVFTRAGIGRYEQNYWVKQTAVGQLFGAGVAIALTVGVIFVYQMMANDIRRQLPEYATVKALGYPGGYLDRVVLAQAVLLALAGYVPGLAAAFGLYALARSQARIPIGMTADRVLAVLGLAVGMCLASGLLAVRKVRSAEPADLF